MPAMSQSAPRSLRLHIGLYGRRNAGKSSLINALTHQQVAIVSPVAGTTTDAVEKPMELLPLGPVVFIDTAGIDDEGALGGLRVAATRRTFERCEVALVVAGEQGWGDPERTLAEELRGRGVPVIAVLNQSDRTEHTPALLAELQGASLHPVCTSAATGAGLDALRAALIAAAPEGFIDPPSLLGDLVPPGGLAVLVVPIDTEAPKGRLIMPQVQSIRDLLDHEAMALVVKERELRAALDRLGRARTWWSPTARPSSRSPPTCRMRCR